MLGPSGPRRRMYLRRRLDRDAPGYLPMLPIVYWLVFFLLSFLRFFPPEPAPERRE